MLLFLSTVSALFLQDTASAEYLVINGGQQVTLGTFDAATDITLLDGTNPLQSLIIQNPVSGLVLDQSGGGDNLISYGMHGASNQNFRLILTADNLLVLVSSEKCLKFNESSKTFVRGSCTAQPTTFLPLIEISYEEPKTSDSFVGHSEENQRRLREMERKAAWPVTQSGYVLNPFIDPRYDPFAVDLRSNPYVDLRSSPYGRPLYSPYESGRRRSI
ncbi:hypothetical protein PAPHI01_0959 [Pancytospora philotis]|nr:hypothetical protein PAPHI01_0959 [Pancytospora philotis]